MSTLNDNILLMADSYKLSQFRQYPAGTEEVFSYIESRGGEEYHVFFGLQMFIKRYLSSPITQNMVDEAAMFAEAHGEPFNREGWEHILDEYNGWLPVVIEAVPEGTVLPTRNVLVTVRNVGGEKTAFVTSYLETILLQAVWYPTTVASLSHRIKRIIETALDATGDVAGLPFKLHDFGYRGVSSNESAGIGGAAHLVNFLGSDTIMGARYANKFYDCNMAGFSIPASEHSTITSWGQDHEIDAFRNMIKQFGKPGAIVACVSDSYNIWKAIEMWKELEQEIIDSGCTLVIRPDSGDPVMTPVKVVQKAAELFGTTTNSKGYKVLPDYIRVIQGDGVNEDSIQKICMMLAGFEFSIDNIAFGMGGALLQQLDRDTMKFAMKCSHITVRHEDGTLEGRDVFKDPITDSGKQSKRGRLGLFVSNNEWKTMRMDENKQAYDDFDAIYMMDVVYDCGLIKNTITFDEVRRNSEIF